MKALKKVLALCLAAILLLALSPAAFADGDATTITIKNAVPEKTYKLYKLFDVVGVADGDNGTKLVSYKVTSKWEDFFKTGTGNQYITLDSNGQPTLKAGATGEALATAIQNYLTNNNTVAADYSSAANSNSVDIAATKGYYFLSSEVGTNCILNTAYENTLVVTEKNSTEPKIDKKILKGNNEVGQNHAGIGEVVNFVAKITLGNNANGYVYHDQMSTGLTFDKSTVVVKIGTKTVESSQYTLLATGDQTLTDGCTFEINFKDTYIESLASGQVITITYSATVNKDAYTKDEETNTGWLHYDNNESVKAQTKTLPMKLTIEKTNENGSKKLSGAKFQLIDSSNNVLNFVAVQDKGYRPAVGGDTLKVSALVTPDGGSIQFYGLKAGNYKLRETEAPGGYNKLTKDVEVTISDEGVVSVQIENNMAAAADGKITVKNQAGTTLPSTGGMGTTLFYVVGGLLMAAAAVLLIAKKRMGKNA